jgi:hypothetical protein
MVIREEKGKTKAPPTKGGDKKGGAADKKGGKKGK